MRSADPRAMAAKRTGVDLDRVRTVREPRRRAGLDAAVIGGAGEPGAAQGDPPCPTSSADGHRNAADAPGHVRAGVPRREPAPATVPYNDWRQVAVPSPSDFEPRAGVTVVVPYFEAQRELSLTLAALEGQTYPAELVEVVVVDDGSRSPPRIAAPGGLDISLVRQEHRGFGLARARNNGALAARHDILVFLDGDMIADPGMLEAHARWHHAVADALTLGLRTSVDTDDLDAAAIRRAAGGLRELLANRPGDPDWREPYLALTDDLTSRHDAPFRAMSGCNFGIRKAFYFAVGGSDESFTEYGLEDTEFAYRVHVRGGLLVPARDARSWHQGRWAVERSRKQVANRLQRPKAANLIAHPTYRDAVPGGIFDVPRYVVTVPVGEERAHQVARTIDAILADPETDLVVRVECSGHARTEKVRHLARRFAGNPSIRLAPGRSALEDFPAAPFHLTVPPTRIPNGGVVGRLGNKLGTAVSASAVLADGSRVTITRAWALHRAGRAGGSAADYGTVRRVRLRNRIRRARRRRPSAWLVDLRAWVRRAMREAGHTRNPRSLAVFCRRFLHRLAHRR